MTILYQFNAFAASRGEGLHPKLRALLKRTAASPFLEISKRRDGLVQAGPGPDSEVVSSPAKVTLFSPEPARPGIAAPKPKMHQQPMAEPEPDRIA
jgi:hypothetical protein